MRLDGREDAAWSALSLHQPEFASGSFVEVETLAPGFRRLAVVFEEEEAARVAGEGGVDRGAGGEGPGCG